MENQQTLHTKALTENINGKLLAVASEEVTDRDGDILSIDGWDLKNFKKNPILLWLHNMSGRSLPIGRAKSIGVKEVDGKKKLVFEPEFEEITEEGKIIGEFYKQGFLKAWSVGFLPIEFEKLDTNEYGMSKYKFIKQELLEVSAVPIPALPSAVMMDNAKSLGLNLAKVKSFIKDMTQIGEDEKPEEKEDGEKEEGQKEPETTEEGVKEDGEKLENAGESEEKPVDEKLEDAKEALNGQDGSQDDNQDVQKEEEKTEDKAAPDQVIKSGRVLSTKNESQLRQAVSIINSVLESLGDKEEDDKKVPETPLEVKLLKHLIGEVQAYRKELKKEHDTILSEKDAKDALKLLSEVLPSALQKANLILKDRLGK